MSAHGIMKIRDDGGAGGSVVTVTVSDDNSHPGSSSEEEEADDIYSVPHKDRSPVVTGTAADSSVIGIAVGRRDNTGDEGPVVVKKSFPAGSKPRGFNLAELYKATPPPPPRGSRQGALPRSPLATNSDSGDVVDAIPLLDKHLKDRDIEEDDAATIGTNASRASKNGASFLAQSIGGDDTSHRVKVVVYDDNDDHKVKKLTIDKEMNLEYKEFLKSRTDWRACALGFSVLAAMLLICGLIAGLTDSHASQEAWEIEQLSTSLNRSYVYLGNLGVVGWGFWQGQSRRPVVIEEIFDANEDEFLFHSRDGASMPRSKRSAPWKVENTVDADSVTQALPTGGDFATVVLLKAEHDEAVFDGCGFMTITHVRGGPIKMNVTETSSGHVTSSAQITIGDATNPVIEGALVSLAVDLDMESFSTLQPELERDGHNTFSVFMVTSPCDILQPVKEAEDVSPTLDDIYDISGTISGDN